MLLQDEYCQVKQRHGVYNFDGKVYFKYAKFRDFYFCTLSEYRSADQCNFNQTNAVLEQFDLQSIVDISMVPDDDIVPWVETKSTLPTLHICLSPDIIEGISNLHTQLIMKNQRDETKDRSSSSVGAMPIGFKKLVGATPPRNISNSNRKHRLKLHGDLPSSKLLVIEILDMVLKVTCHFWGASILPTNSMSKLLRCHCEKPMMLVMPLCP